MRSDGTAVIGSLMSRVSDQTIHFLVNEVGLEAVVAPQTGNPVPPRLTSTLAISGTVAGNIALTAERRTVSEILQRILGDSLAPEEVAPMLEDTLCEVLNVIVGNTSRTLDEDGVRIRIEPPAPVCPVLVWNLAHSEPLKGHRRVIQTNRGSVVIDYWKDSDSQEKDTKWHV
jgi:chemotaxis phosphatase CheX-like protein